MISDVKKRKFEENNDSLEQASGKIKDSNLKSANIISDIEARALANQDYVLENIINDIKENPDAAKDENYKKIFKNLLNDNINNFVTLKKDIEKDKENLGNKIEKGKGFSLDISNKRSLKKAYIDVFGKESNSISFQDYRTLLELKRVLEIDEQIALSELEEV